MTYDIEFIVPYRFLVDRVSNTDSLTGGCKPELALLALTESWLYELAASGGLEVVGKQWSFRRDSAVLYCLRKKKCKLNPLTKKVIVSKPVNGDLKLEEYCY